MPVRSAQCHSSPGQIAHTPPDEAARLAALHCLGILDTPASETFDRITQLAAQLLDVPVALVSFVDEKRQWFKSRFGIEVSQTSRDISFCAHAVYARQVLNVPDATHDVRFADNPLVTGETAVRSYLGVPLYTGAGHAVGTLCAIDTRPRQFSQQAVSALEKLAKILQEQIQAHELALSTESVRRLASEQERLFRDTFEQAAVGIVHTDLSGRLLRVNQRTCSMLGFTHAELSAMSLTDITHPDEWADSLSMLKQLIARQIDEYHLEKRFVGKDGMFLWVHFSVALKRLDSGEADYIIAIIEDISARKRAENELLATRDTLKAEVLRQTSSLQAKNLELQSLVKQTLASERAVRHIEHWLRSITDNVPANIGYWTRNLVCEFANRAYARTFGLAPEQMAGMQMRDVLGEMLFETVEPHIRRVLQGQLQRFERTVTTADGSEAIFDVRFLPDWDDAAYVRGFFILGTDVSESRRERQALEAANLKLTKEAITDFLTGISNRRVFSERSEEAMRRFATQGETYGLILLDLDNFKQVNDVHGHEAGDEVLRNVGRLLKSELRSHRDVAARLGGEEFAILCFGNLDEELLRLIAERVRQKMMRESIKVANGALTITASFGLALSHPSDKGWKDIYARADMAMYQAKAAGKDQAVFASAYIPGSTGRFRKLNVSKSS